MIQLFTMLLVLFAALTSHYLGADEGNRDFSNSKNAKNCPELSGRVVYKENPDYNKARLVSNYYTSKDKFPKVVVYCQNTQDVQNAVLWARCHKVSIRIRSGGHNHEGYSTGNDVIVIDVSEMKELKVDKVANIATIQPGLTNLELYNQLFKQGLTHVGGTCSEVGLSGLVLSGGMGPLLRRVGLTCDSLVSIDMVDAKGQVIHATKDNENRDLFWATCGGGGGNFGVIVSMEIRVYPATDVTWFNIGWDWNQPVEQVIAAWQDFFVKPDRNWFSHLDVWAQPFPSEKTEKQPIKVLGMFWGTPEKAREQLAPLLRIGKPSSEMIESVDWNQAIKLIEESTAVFLTDQPEYKSTGAFAMNSLPPEALKIMVTTLRESTSPLLNVLIFSMGGATADVAPTDTAYFYRNAKFFLQYSSQWLKESEDQKHKRELATLRQRLLPYTVGDYVGNPDPDLKDYLISYYGANAAKLERVKRKYDPENIFRFEQSIPLSTGPVVDTVRDIKDYQNAMQQYEQAGNYASALEMARKGYEESRKQGLSQAAEDFFKEIKQLEDKVLSLGFSRRLFDENGQPRPKLLQLLDLVGMPSLNGSEPAIVQINTWAQQNLLRQGERWHEQTKKFENLEAKIKPLLVDLGFVDAVSPHFKEYQGALVHGALLSRARLRLNYLVEQWKSGVRFPSIYFLSGERPLEDQYENRSTLKEEGGSPLKIRKDWVEPLEYPKTESEMMQLVWEQSEIPEEMRKTVKVYFINAPMKKDPASGKLLRPTTDDTVEAWLKSGPPEGNYLAVTNAPYMNRQDLVIRAIAPKKYGFDTVGSGASKQEKMAIFLDELARSIFQVNSSAK